MSIVTAGHQQCVLALGSEPAFLAWIHAAVADQPVTECSDLGQLMRHLTESPVGLVVVHANDPEIAPLKAVRLILDVNGELPVVGVGHIDDETRSALLAEGMLWCVPLTASAQKMSTGLHRIQREAARQDERTRATSGLYSQLKRHDRWAHEALKSVRELQHELRTPASILQGFCANLLGGFHGELDTEQRDVIERMGNAAAHLVELLTGPQSKLPPPPRTLEEIPDPRQAQRRRIEPEALCKKVAGLFVDKAARADLALEVEVERSCPPFWGDRTRLSQALINLVDNAFRFTPKGGRISIEASRTHGPRGAMVVIEVADTGSGIAADDIERVFESGFTTGAERGHSGTGLAVCRQVADEHVGDLSVTSPPEGGSRFRLSVPVDPRARTRGTRLEVIRDPVLAGQLLAELSARTTAPLSVGEPTDMEQLAEILLGKGGTVTLCAEISPQVDAALSRLASEPAGPTTGGD